MKHNIDTRPSKEALHAKRLELAASGINLREECEKAGIALQAARDVLCGKSAARRGKQHEAAVFLGLKEPTDKAAVLRIKA